MWSLFAENLKNHLVHLLLDFKKMFISLLISFILKHSFIHLRFFFFKHTASATADN